MAGLAPPAPPPPPTSYAVQHSVTDSGLLSAVIINGIWVGGLAQGLLYSLRKGGGCMTHFNSHFARHRALSLLYSSSGSRRGARSFIDFER